MVICKQKAEEDMFCFEIVEQGESMCVISGGRGENWGDVRIVLGVVSWIVPSNWTRP